MAKSKQPIISILSPWLLSSVVVAGGKVFLLRHQAWLVVTVARCHGSWLGLVAQGEEELGEAALGCGVVAEHRGEGRITERLGEALAESFTSASVVGEARKGVSW